MGGIFVSVSWRRRDDLSVLLTACDRLYYCVELEDISILAVIFLLLFTVYFYDSNTRQKLMFNVHVRDRLPETVHS